MCAYNRLLGSADICPLGTADPNIGSFHAIVSMRVCILCRKHLKQKKRYIIILANYQLPRIFADVIANIRICKTAHNGGGSG